MCYLSVSVLDVSDAYTLFSMVLIATLCLTIFHPGYCFPQMQMKNKPSVEGDTTEPKIISDVESQ